MIPKLREILRLESLGFSERNIAVFCSVSRNTVSKVIHRADELNTSWPLDYDMTDNALEKLMFPKEKSATDKRLPDYDYIRKELLKNGVTKKRYRDMQHNLKERRIIEESICWILVSM